MRMSEKKDKPGNHKILQRWLIGDELHVCVTVCRVQALFLQIIHINGKDNQLEAGNRRFKSQ